MIEKLNNEKYSFLGEVMDRSEIIKQIKSTADFSGDDQNKMNMAYQLAGMMSYEDVRKLSKDDPINVTLELAGRLELPEEHRQDGDSWDALKQSIDELN